MKSERLRATLLAAAALTIGAMASPTMAKTLTYYFVGDCDGLTITDDGTGSVWSGAFIGCSDAIVGGFRTRIGGLGRFITLSAAAPSSPGGFETFLLDTKALKWYLYASAPSGVAFDEVNAGALTKKPPEASSKVSVRSSISNHPKAMDKPVF